MSLCLSVSFSLFLYLSLSLSLPFCLRLFLSLYVSVSLCLFVFLFLSLFLSLSLSLSLSHPLFPPPSFSLSLTLSVVYSSLLPFKAVRTLLVYISISSPAVRRGSWGWRSLIVFTRGEERRDTAADVSGHCHPSLSGSLRECQRPCDDNARPRAYNYRLPRALVPLPAPDSFNIVKCFENRKAYLCFHCLSLPVESVMGEWGVYRIYFESYLKQWWFEWLVYWRQLELGVGQSVGRVPSSVGEREARETAVPPATEQICHIYADNGRGENERRAFNVHLTTPALRVHK